MSNVLEPVKRSTLSETVMEQLAKLILNGDFKPGERLPSERQMASELGVARGPVREALRALALVGLVDIRPGHGAFARDPGEPAIEISIADTVLREVSSIRDVYQARKVIESEQIILAAERITPEQLEQLEQLMEEMRALAKEDPSRRFDFAELHYRFDHIVAEAADNGILLAVFQSLRNLEMSTHLKVLRLPAAMENSLVQQERILRALQAGDAELAAEAARLHFESVDDLLEHRLEEH